MGRDPVEEPPVVADHDDAAGEPQERLLEGAQRIDVEIVGRFVEQEQVPAALQELREVEAVSLPTGQVLHPFLLVAPLEIE